MKDMITLNELFEVTWNITELDVMARDPGGHLLHEWIFGQDVVETIHMYHRRIAGELTIRQEKINHHGEDTGRGTSEIGWGVKEQMIPKELRESPITHLIMSNRRSGETKVYCDAEMQELTCEMIISREGNNA